MRTLLGAAFLMCPLLVLRAAPPQGPIEMPPPMAREFRGEWVATVANIDWPSKPGLTTALQKAELISLLNRAAELKLNAIIFQVRPACDAIYASQIEPWSEYLTGTMGKAPEPYYDPLEFVIEQAHQRGMELHAWFNPYRALHKSHQGQVSAGHISKTHPQFVRSYGQYLWLDPGEREVQDYSLRVVMDVVKRYDIDGVQFDDYFYPDPSEVGRDFPDQASWKKYGAGGKFNRNDWRRENVNAFISRIYTSIKAAKPWVKFGVSPAGIWRPRNPPQISGSDAYSKYFADSRKWLMNGWLDYCAPQLYWQIGRKEQSFPVLLDWWSQQNVKNRHLWPGMSVAYSLSQKWSPNEIPQQIQIERKQPGTKGYILYSAHSLGANSTLTEMMEREPTALVPASPWLESATPPKPNLSMSMVPTGVRLDWNSGTNSIRWWVVERKTYGDWKTEILPGDILSKSYPGVPEAVSVTAIDRFENASVPCVLQMRRNPAEERMLLKK